MNSQDYQEQTRRTDIEDYSPIMERITQNKQTVHQAFTLFMIASGTLDLMKKKIMYDADPFKLLAVDAEQVKIRKVMESGEYLDKIAQDPKLSKLFHYVTGVITEANEMVAALVTGALSESLDVTNVGEEIADQEWYQSRIADVLGLDIDTLRQKNIDKLKARFPTKFTNESANNRDLETERKILEA